MIVYEDLLEEEEDHMRRKLIGHAAVDSGQMMLVDPCYVLGDTDTRDRISYDDACELTCGPDMAGQLATLEQADGGLACVSSTGWGDGLYPVYVDYDDSEGRVSALHIQFMDPPDPDNWPTKEEPEIEIEEDS